MELKRELVKYIRDKAKSLYTKDTRCMICGTSEALDLHHYNTLSLLVHRWAKGRKLDTVDLVLEQRDNFIENHYTQLYTDVVTLCKEHHKKLHKVYGTAPPLGTAKKQLRWVIIQREKYGMV